MRRSPPLAAALLVACLAAGAAAARTSDRFVLGPAPVTAVASSGAVVAFATGPTSRDCDRVRRWNLGTRGIVRLGQPRPCGDATSTGRGLAGLAVAHARALWITYVGGNIREWSLWTATPGKPTPRLVSSAARDVDDPQPLVIGGSDKALLPWAIDATVTGLRSDGARVFRTTLASPVRALATGAGQVAALLADGHVVVLAGDGTMVRDYAYAPGDVRAVALGGVGVLVQRRHGVLDVRKGAAARTIELPSTALMLDFAEGVLLYSVGAQLRGRKLSTGRDVLVRIAPTPVQATLDASGLVYADGRRVRFVPTRAVAAAFSEG